VPLLAVEGGRGVGAVVLGGGGGGVVVVWSWVLGVGGGGVEVGCDDDQDETLQAAPCHPLSQEQAPEAERLRARRGQGRAG